MKILLITAAFAPRGSSASVRNVNFVKYLDKIGHKVHVLTYNTQSLTIYSERDDILSAKVPASAQITRSPGGLLRRWLSRRNLGNYRGAQADKVRITNNPLVNLLIPDPQCDAVPGFTAMGSNIIEAWNPDIVITHGYPFSMHWVGFRLKKRFPQLLWVADYGDPWVGEPVTELPRPRWRRVLDKWLEGRWLSRCDMVTVTTEPTRALYTAAYPFLKTRVEVIEMGFDPDDFVNIPAMPRPAHLEGKLLLVHAGRIYPQARDPAPFIGAVAQLLSTRPELAQKLAIVLVGETDKAVHQIIKDHQCEQVFHIIDWVPVAESIAWMKSADWLLLFGNKGGIQIPGKVYQYLGCNRPIFMTQINPDDPTTNMVRRATDSVVAPNSVASIATSLTKILTTDTSCLPQIKDSESHLYSWPELMRRLTQGIERLHNKVDPNQ